MRRSVSIAHYVSQGFMSAKGALQHSLGRRPRFCTGTGRRESRTAFGLGLIEAPPHRDACGWPRAFTALLGSCKPDASWVGAALSWLKPGASPQAMLRRAFGAHEGGEKAVAHGQGGGAELTRNCVRAAAACGCWLGVAAVYDRRAPGFVVARGGAKVPGAGLEAGRWVFGRRLGAGMKSFPRRSQTAATGVPPDFQFNN